MGAFGIDIRDVGLHPCPRPGKIFGPQNSNRMFGVIAKKRRSFRLVAGRY
jgi:hypothetical protein